MRTMMGVKDIASVKRVIETSTGVFVDPIDPDPDSLKLEDMANALSRVCRFTGHANRHYSVAEHSLLVADYLEHAGYGDEVIYTGLMHDTTEAYIPDLAAPLKHSDWGAPFIEAEDRLMSVIAERFKVIYPFPEEVGYADLVLVWCEGSVLLPSRTTTWPRYEEIGKKLIEANKHVVEWIRDRVYKQYNLSPAWLKHAEYHANRHRTS